jgi:hypothetical protein
MSTLADLETDVETALAADGLTIMPSYLRTESHAVRSTSYVGVGVASSSRIVASSNVTRQIADVILVLVHRAAGPSLAQAGAAETVIRDQISDYTDLDFWIALASVAQSPLPEISVESESEQVGEVITAQLRAQVVLEV